MRFVKMHGTGNDYIYVDCFQQTVEKPERVAKAVANRRTGIGGDGLILICPSDRAAARMEMYNADGSRGGMCGNGLRCVAKYVFEQGLTGDPSFAIETDAGDRTVYCDVSNGIVRAVTIDMGEPRLRPGEIPVRLDGERAADVPINAAGREWRMTCVSMGNPHAVVFVDALGQVDVAAVGPAFENHELFPRRVNTHFVEVVSRRHVRVLHWERGSGRTMACGTGVSAVCVAGTMTGRTDRTIDADVEGGRLRLEWRNDNHVFKTGPAVEVFRGEWHLHEPARTTPGPAQCTG